MNSKSPECQKVIAILTQPLHTNYGGILQNYALQTTLKRLGYNPITIDYYKPANYRAWIIANINSLLILFLRFKWRGFFPRPTSRRTPPMSDFVSKYINTTKRTNKYDANILKDHYVCGIVVGSDQVWRPKYNEKCLNELFLSFAKGYQCPKISYAASFGTDNWEYTDEQTKECKGLIKEFSGVSVRESSAIELCQNKLGAEATEVLDPTFLLDAEDYQALFESVSKDTTPYLAVYCLDVNETKMRVINRIADNYKLPIRFMTIDYTHQLSIQEWLQTISNASFVITDSFHGTAFSIIFKRQFFSLINNQRGASRFRSLLSKFSLEDRIIDENYSSDVVVPMIDYDNVEKVLAQKKDESISFITEGLR